tara:strand:- start:24 stop:266 length:243 start_codon:yes stop_codon:yes gene_type:complete
MEPLESDADALETTTVPLCCVVLDPLANKREPPVDSELLPAFIDTVVPTEDCESPATIDTPPEKEFNDEPLDKVSEPEAP